MPRRRVQSAAPQRGDATRDVPLEVDGPPKKSASKLIEQYGHKDERRANNPPVGLVTPATDRDAGRKSYRLQDLA